MKKLSNPWRNLEGYYCFGCAPQNPTGLKMTFYTDGDDIVSKWTPDKKFQGWLNTLHGGIQATLLDEICAWTVIYHKQTTGVTFKMETKYLKPISTIDEELTLKAHIVNEKRNVVFIEAKLYNKNGDLCTEATCTYFTISPKEAKDNYFFSSCTTSEE